MGLCSACSPTARPAQTPVHVAAGHCAGLGGCATAAGTQDTCTSLLPSETWSWARTREAGTGLGSSVPHATYTALSKPEWLAVGSAAPRPACTVHVPALLAGDLTPQLHLVPYGRSPRTSADASRRRRQLCQAGARDAVLRAEPKNTSQELLCRLSPTHRRAEGVGVLGGSGTRSAPPAHQAEVSTGLLAQPVLHEASSGAGRGPGPSCGWEEGAASSCQQLSFLEMKKTEGRES